MVAFETLLLGIVFGRGAVRLAVAPPVVAVELRLDEAAVTVMHGPPWATTCEFGPDLLPHVLTAIGLDRKGREVARATQWVNIGRERIKVTALLERDPKTGRPVAVRPVWNTSAAAEPKSVVATLDGGPLPVTDPHRIPLPAVNLSETHMVSVELTFPDSLRGRADLALGGDVIASAESELTAVAVLLPPKVKFLDVRSLSAAFSLGPSHIRPIAVDEGRAEVVFVLSAGARIVVGFVKELHAHGALEPNRDRASFVRSASARMVDQDGTVRDLFGVSEPIRLSRIGHEVTFGRVAAGSTQPRDEMIADTVAVAGAEAAGSNHRRAVVLVLSEPDPEEGGAGRPRDRSTFQIPAVKAYLAALDVPLVVWSLGDRRGEAPTSAWGPAEDVSTLHRLRKARAKLERELAAQRIVWFSGRLLPQRITLNAGATGIKLAR